MAAQELRWLIYVLTDLGEQPRSPPVLYVDNKAMIALCQEHRLEHRTKHITLRYFLARELQQHGQLRLAYVATRANTADVFTKAILPGRHQGRPQSIDQPFPTSRCKAAQGEADVEEGVVDEGRGNSGGKSGGDGEASFSMVGVVELMVSLALEAGEDFQAVAAAMQANLMAVLLDSGCSHHLMGTKAAFIDMVPSDGVKHIRGFNGALQPIEGRETVALQEEAEKQVLIPDVLYVSGVQANLLSAGQLKESGVQLQGDVNEMLLVAAIGEVLSQARYN
ncbi:unnamed protein product [Closterium sp. NIES-54]